MSWGGVEAIPLRSGETRQQAVDRVYSGGTYIGLGDDGVPVIGQIPRVVARDPYHVGRAERQWMLHAREILERGKPGWELYRTETKPGRRWPWLQTLDHPDLLMWVTITGDYINFKADGGAADDSERRFWWSTLRKFAKLPCAIFDPDNSELVATSISAAEARDR